MLAIRLHDYGALKMDTLPPRLTVLIIVGMGEEVLLSGSLPTSLVRLIIRHKADVLNMNEPTAVQPIAAGVIPSQLQQLDITWPRSLADLTLPPSLTELELCCLPDLPIPPSSLPPHLHTLCIYTLALHAHHLADALSTSLRVLRLHSFHWVPLTGELLAQVPQLEELDLGGYYRWPLTAGMFALLSRLRVLRVGSQGRLPIEAGVLPLSLHRLTMVAATMEEADALVPMAARHARLVVDFDSSRVSVGQTTQEIFVESRRMILQAV